MVGFEFLVARAVRRRGHAGSRLAVDTAGLRAAAIGVAAAAVLLASAVARLAPQVAAVQEPGGAPAGALLSTMLLRTPWGWGWLLQVVAAATALVAFFQVRRTHGRGWPMALGAALALMVTPSLAGHAAAVTGYGPFPVLTDSLHVLAAGGWLGTLLVVLAAGLPTAARLEASDRGIAVAELVTAFSPAALVSAGVLAASGTFSARLPLETLPAFWQSRYGRTLLLKLGILGGVLATGF